MHRSEGARGQRQSLPLRRGADEAAAKLEAKTLVQRIQKAKIKAIYAFLFLFSLTQLDESRDHEVLLIMT